MMKKLILAASLILSFLLLFGCTMIGDEEDNKETSEPQQSPEQQKRISDYFPIKEDVKYVYEGKGNEYASYDLYIDFTSEDKVQQRKSTGGTVLVDVIEIKDDKVTRTFSRGETYYRENLLDKKSSDEQVLLMEPLEKGTTWTLKDGSIRTITETSAQVTTPMDSFEAIEVTTESINSKRIDYYAKDIGLVQSVFTSEGSEISSSLSKVEKDAVYTSVVNFYQPSGVDDKIYYKGKGISFKTNDETAKILEEAYKEGIDADLGKVITEKTKINSLTMDENKIVKIDLSKEFAEEMNKNAGALFEGMILQSLVNTFGQYYNAEKVIVTIDNKPYESGHISMGEGEFFQTNFTKAVEIKQ
mgnify:FL=1